MEIPFRRGRLPAVTIPWGDVATAWYSTGIPNIEVYMAVTGVQAVLLRAMRPVAPLLRFSAAQKLARQAIRWFVRGPSPEERAKGRGSFWGRVTNARGQHAEATLETANGYQLTVWTALASLEKVFAGQVSAGFATPSQAFGAEFILSIPQSDFRWET
jgi:short subunit dehydrogenase-like uncharacterized protein